MKNIGNSLWYMSHNTKRNKLANNNVLLNLQHLLELFTILYYLKTGYCSSLKINCLYFILLTNVLCLKISLKINCLYFILLTNVLCLKIINKAVDINKNCIFLVSNKIQ